MKQEIYGLWIMACLTLGYLGGSRGAIAQIVPDGTLPSNSIVTPNGEGIAIDGGTAAGGNLFHSFQDFNVPINNTAHFNNALTIDNIITRVTGGNLSNIDGIIRANGTANLFLINPAGLVFGENASLDIGGSFVGSTAEALQFEDGSLYGAVDVDAPPLLTISVPVGLQFGAEPGSIDVAGGGHNLRLVSLPFALEDRDSPNVLLRRNRPPGLQVQPDRTLALVGGDIKFNGGHLTAESGRIELGSVAPNSTVTLTQIDPLVTEAGWQLGYEGVEQFGDISLSGAASIDTSGPGAGAVQIQGRSLSLTDGSAIVATTLGDEAGEDVTIRTMESIEFIGTTPDLEIESGIRAEVEFDATGSGGNVRIQTERFLSQDGAAVSVSTRGGTRQGEGNAGNLILEATDVTLSGMRIRMRDGERKIAGLFSEVLVGSTGNSGNINIETERLSVTDRASISASTLRQGHAGNITIRARESIEVSNVANLRTVVGNKARGDGGDLSLETDRLLVSEGANIASTTIGEGNAGNLTIVATEMDIRGIGLDGQGRTVPSRLEAQVNGLSLGNGGNLTIRADRLTLRDGGRISAATFSSGNAGTLEITASQIELSGGQDFFDGLPAGLVVSVAEDGSGDAGSLRIRADRLTIREGMEASVSSQGQGAAGNLEINASELFLDRGILNAETARGNIGDITLNTSDLRLRNRSEITTNAMGASTGGNITIFTDTLTALENSDITANAEASLGGRVNITAQGIFGTQFRENQTPESDITATSALGPQFSGIVDIQTPDVDPSSGLLELPDTPIDATAIIGRDPCRHGDRSEFISTGRGGLPPNPRGVLHGEEGQVQLVTLDASVVPAASGAIPQPQPDRLIEAQGWIIGDNGQVILTANPPNVSPHGNGSFPITCESSKFGEEG